MLRLLVGPPGLFFLGSSCVSQGGAGVVRDFYSQVTWHQLVSETVVARLGSCVWTDTCALYRVQNNDNDDDDDKDNGNDDDNTPKQEEQEEQEERGTAGRRANASHPRVQQEEEEGDPGTFLGHSWLHVVPVPWATGGSTGGRGAQFTPSGPLLRDSPPAQGGM